jgi:protein TIF31
VSIAKQEKDVQARRLRAGIRFVPRNAPVGASSTSVVGGAGPAAGSIASSLKRNAPTIDSRNIDDLISFIEGTEKQKKGAASAESKKRAAAARSNPKRRGGSQAVSTTA